MHIHLPKPLHGWREFVGEVGIIVIGVLIALGAEQAIEALHHRSQINEATATLRAENAANRSALDVDIFGLQESEREIDSDLAVLGNCERAVDGARLVPLGRRTFLVPTDSAWIGVRDSALLPLLPARLSDNYYKLDAVRDLMILASNDVHSSDADAGALVEAMRHGVRDPVTCRDAVVHLYRLEEVQLRLLNQTQGYRQFSDEARRGERIDAVARPGPLNVPKQD